MTSESAFTEVSDSNSVEFSVAVFDSSTALLRASKSVDFCLTMKDILCLFSSSDFLKSYDMSTLGRAFKLYWSTGLFSL